MLEPAVTRRSPEGMVATVDHLAAEAGVHMLRQGGNAVDAAIAGGAVLAVTFQNRNGIGGDLLATLVPPEGEPLSLRATGFAGSGADPDRARAEGLTRIAPRGDARAITLPGCVDGWTALHDRFGSLPLEEIFRPAITYATRGFPAAPLLARDFPSVAALPAAAGISASGALVPGQLVTQPGIARLLEVVAKEGRSGFYEGEFGRELLAVAPDLFSEEDLRRSTVRFAPPLSLEVFGHRLLTVPPCSSGYLTLSSAWLAEHFGVPEDPDSPEWAHALIEAARHAAFDRLDVLHEGADGTALLDEARLRPRLAMMDRDRAAVLPDTYRRGGTISLMAVDRDRFGVSLMQSNCNGFGSHFTLPSSGVFLHNRGIGFSLERGHPNELRPGAFPAHTLSPVAVTRADGGLAGVVASAGGDSQPHLVLQFLTRWLAGGQAPGDVLAAGRFVLRDPREGGTFDTWERRGEVTVTIEGNASGPWEEGLRSRGHDVERRAVFGDGFGHAHMIAVEGDVLAGAADPRSGSGGVVGY